MSFNLLLSMVWTEELLAEKGEGDAILTKRLDHYPLVPMLVPVNRSMSSADERMEIQVDVRLGIPPPNQTETRKIRLNPSRVHLL
jgi:hypothetical protein